MADTLPLQPLKPWAALRLLRPVRFRRLTAASRDAARSCQAIALLRQHFPAQLPRLAGALRLEEWPVTLTVFLDAVENEAWFEINWTVLGEAHQYMLSEAGDGGDRLALFLTYIPVKMLGFSHSDGKIFELPPMELLRVLLHTDVEVVTTSLRLEAHLDWLEEWRRTDQNRQAAWARLRQIETNPTRYAEPVRFLPELARWACGNTGNPLLDQHFDPRRNGPWFRWDTELPLIRSAWRRAKPVYEAYLRLMEWYGRDPQHLIHLADYITGDIHDTNNLTW
jgi:hypothetical protein